MIKLKNVSKQYLMGEVEINALDSVNLKIKRGEFLTIMGPSGSGKSTLLNVLGVLDQPTEGDYLLEDINITELRDKELAQIRNRHFGFIFQSYNLFPELTALENVMVPLNYARRPRAERETRAKELLAQVEMNHRLHHFPNQLSGGEQQRVAIARALANSPTLLLADEPTGNLASDQGQEILKLLSQLNEQGTTIIVVTHDPHISTFGKRIIRIQDGKIVADESVEKTA